MMRLKKLRFRDELIPLILSGRKRATIRLGTKSLSEGEVVYIASETTGRVFGKARITRIVQKKLSELSDEDARMDGFRDRIALLEALKAIYGDLPEDSPVYVIEFTVLWESSINTG